MSVVPPSMVHRSGDSLIVRSVVSGDALFGSVAAAADAVQDYTDDGNDDDDAESTSTPTAAAPAGAVPEDVAVAPAAATTTSTDLPECKVKRNYSCSSCDFYTQNPRHYLYHLRDVHEEKVRIYECHHCLYASKHFQKLLRHTKMVHNNSLVGEDQQQQPARIRTRKRSSAIKTEPQSQQQQQQPSPQPQQPQQPPLQQQPQQQPQSAPEDDTADEVDDSSAELEDEFGDELLATTAAAASGVFKCSMCQFTARTSALLTRHEREDHIKTKFFKCNKCAYATHMKARFTKHVKYHSMPMIKCEQCDFRTPYKWNLDRHSKNHNGRGAFRCSACNFTADIKQSLTVHEMNHHVPPVGQAAGVGVGRRRNKVGASDATAAEEAAVTLQHQQQQEQQEPQTTKSADQEVSTPAPSEDQKKVQVKLETTITTNTTIQPTHPPVSKKLKLCLHAPEQSSFGSDFIHPDDVIHHANGNVYIKSKCKLCNFKSAWATEMTKHEKKVHNIVRETSPKPAAPTKKSTRPIPNLIPLPLPAQNKLQKPKVEPSVMEEPIMSQQDIKDICAKSKNSSLKDFASLFGSEDVFKDVTENNNNNNNICKVPDLLPASFATSTPNSIDNNIINNKLNNNNNDEYFKQKNASFFDKLKERLMTGAGGSCSMTCKNCGHESKCLTEQAKHQKICGKEISQAPIIPPLTFSSSRCQYCRQRCKSSADLYNHLQTCSEALKTVKPTENNNVISINEESEGELRIDESQSEDGDNQNRPHPMENRVFVWNNIEVPMDIEVDDTSPYEFTETESKVDDNVSLDLSIRTQSPVGSENSYPEYNTTSMTTTPQIHHQVPAAPTTEKIPTHGNDISVAQHKRVFRCPHCTFWASTASRFHVHIVGHLNKKPFECSLCNYRSNWRWDITKHIKLKSVRDPAHESAKVLMTDETGRRNYTKYNKYLTEIHVSGDQTLETSGGSGTRPKHHDRNQSPSQIPIHKTAESSMPKLTRAPNNNSEYGPMIRTSPLRPPPPLKAADGSFFVKVAESKKQKSSSNAENKRTLFKCKKCNFRDASREILLAHVKGHYPQNGIEGATVGLTSNNNQTTMNNNNISGTTLHLDHQQDQHEQHENDSVNNLSPRSSSPELKDEASVSTTTAKGTQAPFRCGHCNQVSNWKHVIQRHCRLKHSGDIRVVSNKNGQERLEIEEQTDEPDHVDVIQTGTFKCNSCPYSSDVHGDFKTHLSGHSSNPTSIMKCHYCNFFVDKKEDILDHLKLHGVLDPDDFLSKMLERNALVDAGGDLLGKRFKCLICPYVTNSKSQYTYHKQFHKPRGGQYTCTQCSYNVSKRHLLHQHLKVHGISVAPQKQNGDVIDLDDMSDEIEEVVPCSSNGNGGAEFEAQHFLDIPLVWVSKNGKFSKMFKCRYCPHVNLRKVNIQEHEKMHSIREKNPNTSRPNDVEHRCSECNYVCNNAGVLSSHSKVHQGLYGTVHCLVDQVKSDEEQIRELTKIISPHLTQIAEPISLDEYENAESSGILDSMAEDSTDENASLYFCRECPARFMKEAEYSIHLRLHGVRLFYKCTYCSYSARQKPHLLAHKKVHTSEYQDRTRVLQTMYNPINTPPQSYSITDSNGDLVWLVYENIKLNDVDMEDLSAMISKPTKSTVNVPLSGTELFQQKNEAEQKQQAQMLLKESSPPSPKVSDTQFGALMHGNPEFIYPTYVKNGRMKEKRYKCHKCPSAFEKREQYKVHLNLHGSKQRYRCEHCDYSVKYYANFVQHLKKHKMNSDAQAARRPSDPSDDNELLEANEEIDEDAEENADPMPNGFGKLSVGDQQAYKILQQRLTESSVSRDDAVEDKDNNKKQFHCPNCPYVSHRKDAVDNHQKRHTSVSGIKNNFTCEHCDYSVPQEHFLREHVRLHFIPNKRNSRVDGYMLCDNFKLVSSKIAENNDGDECKSSVIFEEKGLKQEDKEFLPPLSDEVTERFNNNDGERRLVSVSNAGELTTSTVVMDKTTNDKNSSATVVDESHGNNSSIRVVNGEIEDS